MIYVVQLNYVHPAFFEDADHVYRDDNPGAPWCFFGELLWQWRGDRHPDFYHLRKWGSVLG